MEKRRDIWRTIMMGKNTDHQRHLYYTFIQQETKISPKIFSVIKADIPRTYPNNQWVREQSETIKTLLIRYAAIHKGDSYLQGFNYIMTIIYRVFYDTEHAEADTWWCFSVIVGRIRPLMPDFNINWFHWCRRHWMEEFHTRLRKKRPSLDAVILNESEAFSSLLTIKWFMLWFAQSVAFEEIFELWDFLIQLPAQHLMMAYTLITFEVLHKEPIETTHSSTHVIHTLLKTQFGDIAALVAKVKKNL